MCDLLHCGCCLLGNLGETPSHARTGLGHLWYRMLAGGDVSATSYFIISPRCGGARASPPAPLPRRDPDSALSLPVSWRQLPASEPRRWWRASCRHPRVPEDRLNSPMPSRRPSLVCCCSGSRWAGVFRNRHTRQPRDKVSTPETGWHRCGSFLHAVRHRPTPGQVGTSSAGSLVSGCGRGRGRTQ